MQNNIYTDEPFVDGYLLYLMAQASAAVSAAFHAQIEASGVPVSRWRILASLYPDKRLNVGELAQRCLAKQPTLTRQLDKTCADGLTERVAANGDRRSVLVCLTPAGRARAAELIALAREHEAQTVAAFSDTEVAAMKAMLKRFAADLG